MGFAGINQSFLGTENIYGNPVVFLPIQLGMSTGIPARSASRAPTWPWPLPGALRSHQGCAPWRKPWESSWKTMENSGESTRKPRENGKLMENLLHFNIEIKDNKSKEHEGTNLFLLCWKSLIYPCWSKSDILKQECPIDPNRIRTSLLHVDPYLGTSMFENWNIHGSFTNI